MSTIGEVLSAALGTVKKANAQDAVFQDKSNAKEPDTADSQSDSSPGSRSPLKPKDFYWDQMVVILVSAILGLTVLDIAVEFFRGFGVQCYTPASVAASPPKEFTRDQAAYVNSYCYQSLPPSEYYPVFIIVHGLAIVAPHYLWSSLFGGYFEFFFDLAKDLNRLRNIKTGKYDARDFEIVKKLEKEYTGRIAFYSYILKLLLQFFITVFSFLFAVFFFNDFSPNFTCPREGLSQNGTTDWPLNETVTCVYTSLRFLSVIRIVDCILTGLAVFVIIFGLFWCLFRHSSELGHRDVARFVVGSCFLPEHYIPKRFLANGFAPRIRDDLDFLVMQLFRTDSGHGQVFKEIQVQREVGLKTREEYELLQLFWTVETRGELRREDVYKLFKDAGFKGLPRLDVYRRFSPLFGITKKELCKEPLGDEELKKIAEEIAAAGPATVASLALKLGQGSPDEQQEATLEKKTKTILTQWQKGGVEATGGSSRLASDAQVHISSGRSRRAASSRIFPVLLEMTTLDTVSVEDAPDNSNSRPHQPPSNEAPSHQDQPPSNGAEHTDNGSARDRKQLANHLQEMGSTAMKLTAFAVRYGTYLEPEAVVEAFQNRIHGFLRITPQSNFALDISFGSTGCAHILAWAFKEVVSVNFDPYLQDEDSVVKVDSFFTNVVTMRLPIDIFTQRTDNVAQVETAFIPIIYGAGEIGLENMRKDQPISRVDFIVIGPIDHEAKNVTVTLLIDKLHTDQAIRKGAVLLAIRPLEIGGTDTSSRFTQYVPPPSLFACISKSDSEDDQYKKLRLEIEQEVRKRSFRVIDDSHDHRVYYIPTKCGNIECLLEFSVYTYGKPEVKSKGNWSSSNDKNQKMRDRGGVRKSRSGSHGLGGLAVPVAGVLRLVDCSREECTREWSEPQPGDPVTTNSGLRRRVTTAASSGVQPAQTTVADNTQGRPLSHGRAIPSSTVDEEQESSPVTLRDDDAVDSGRQEGGEHVNGSIQNSLPSMTSEEEYWFNRTMGGVPADGSYQPPVRPDSEGSSEAVGGPMPPDADGLSTDTDTVQAGLSDPAALNVNRSTATSHGPSDSVAVELGNLSSIDLDPII